MCDDETTNVKSRLLDILVDLDQEELDSVEQWISSQSYKNDLKTKKSLRTVEKQLVKIGNALKKIVPFAAEMSTESIAPPTVGDQADCNEVNTCHVDEFLYDDKEVEDLVRKGKLKRHYCLDCNSRNIKELTYISHSMSVAALRCVFTVLLPPLGGLSVLDVGSRLGAVLYGAYYFSNASSITGVEMNEEWCRVQNEIIQKFAMDTERIKVIQADVTEKPDLVQSADVIIINVLDFFVDNEKHKQMWHFFRKNIKKGTYVVMNRSIADTFEYLELFEEFMGWLTIAKPEQVENELFCDIEDYSELFLYTVK